MNFSTRSELFQTLTKHAEKTGHVWAELPFAATSSWQPAAFFEAPDSWWSSAGAAVAKVCWPDDVPATAYASLTGVQFMAANCP